VQLFDFDAAFLDLNPAWNGRFGQWLFHPGMLFETRRKWWSGAGLRGTAHEGIDFCSVLTAEGTVCRIGPEDRFPAILPGRVALVLDDLLGQTLVLEHPEAPGDGWPLASLYAHARPVDAVQPGCLLQAGDPVVTVPPPKRSINGMHAHLHLSVIRVDPARPLDQLDWRRINARDGLQLESPFTWLTCRHRIEAMDLV